jgi:glucose/arabinose dehydrogenase
MTRSGCHATPPLAWVLAVLLAGCSGGGGGSGSGAAPATPGSTTTAPPPPAAATPPAGADAALRITALQTFEEPWAMAALPDGRLLVTSKPGRLFLVEPGVRVGEVRGVPQVAYNRQGGLGDVVLHPGFPGNGWIYLSYAEPDAAGRSGAAVARARLVTGADGGGELADLQVLWRQLPKVDGEAHYSHRIAFGADGLLWISSGDRYRGEPAQDPGSGLGKLLRLRDDGSAPRDNPFAGQGGTAAQVWSLGHRNVLGLAFDGQGQLWMAEMGPRGGDELNRAQREANFGWPRVSDGDDYDGSPIPDHATAPQFAAPSLTWTPVISPSSLVFYSGAEFPEWRGQALLGGLSARALVRVAFDGLGPREVARHALGARIREVEQAPDGALYVLEDGPRGRLLRLQARR